MSSKHLIHPELLNSLDEIEELDLRKQNMPRVRANIIAQFEELSKSDRVSLRDNIRFQEMLATGTGNNPSVRVLVYTPLEKHGPFPAFLHIHGGGFIMGTPEMDDARNRQLSAELGCVIVSVDYRLAPETPYPGPIEDCYTALTWMHSNSNKLEIDPNKIAIGGESAGGGLAACLAILSCDRGEVSVMFQLLIYPMLDDRTCTIKSPNPVYGEFSWLPKYNKFGWTSMLGHEPGGTGVSAYVSASRADNLAGLPPAYIVTGSVELFLEENIEYARRLMAAGVSTELSVIPGAYHAFDLFAPNTNVTINFKKNYFKALGKAFA